MTSVVGDRLAIAFEIHDWEESYLFRQINFWIGGKRLVTSGCWLPAFLQMSQRFVQRQQVEDDPEIIERIGLLSDQELLAECDTHEFISQRQLFYKHVMSNFDEATTDYAIYAFQAPQRRMRLLWFGRAEHKLCPREHAGKVHSAYISQEQLFATFESLLEFFGANTRFTDEDWGRWYSEVQGLESK